MIIRNSHVANSSSSYFIVLLRKGTTFEQLIQSAGDLAGMVKPIIDYIAKEVGELQSIENYPLYKAMQEYGSDTPIDELMEIARDEFDWYTEDALTMLSNEDNDPKEWFIGVGSASYNDSWEGAELFLGMSTPKIDSENFKMKGVSQ